MGIPKGTESMRGHYVHVKLSLSKGPAALNLGHSNRDKLRQVN